MKIATKFLIELAARTSRIVDGQELADTIGERYLEPIAEYRDKYRRQVDRLRKIVQRKCRSEKHTFVLVHGDFNPGNVFVSAKSGALCGVIDWDAYESAGLPLTDLFSFLFGMNPKLRKLQIGQRVEKGLQSRMWNEDEDQCIQQYVDALGLDNKYLDIAFIAYWAKHVSTHIKFCSDRLDPTWERMNLDYPLSQFVKANDQ